MMKKTKNKNRRRQTMTIIWQANLKLNHVASKAVPFLRENELEMKEEKIKSKDKEKEGGNRYRCMRRQKVR